MFRHRFDVGTMLRVFELNVKNPAFAKQKNSSNVKGFLWRTSSTQNTCWPAVSIRRKPDMFLFVSGFILVCRKLCFSNNSNFI